MGANEEEKEGCLYSCSVGFPATQPSNRFSSEASLLVLLNNDIL